MAVYADTPEGRRFVERVKGYFEAAKDRIDLAAIRDKMVKELKRAPNITDDEKARIEDGIFTMHGEVLRRKGLNMKSKNSLTDLYSQSVKVAKKYPRDSFEFKAQERLAAEFWKNFTEAERKELERLGYFARNTIVSTNAVVAKALAMNGWDSKMEWEFESKIESAIKSELGTVTDVGAAFKDGGYDTGGSRNGAISVGLYDDKARKNVGRIKQIVEKILKQYGGGRITSQKVMKLAGEDAVEFTVARNSRAMNDMVVVNKPVDMPMDAVDEDKITIMMEEYTHQYGKRRMPRPLRTTYDKLGSYLERWGLSSNKGAIIGALKKGKPYRKELDVKLKIEFVGE